MAHPTEGNVTQPRIMTPLSIIHLIWEFTESNFFTFVVPNTAFGLLGALATSQLGSGSGFCSSGILYRLPMVVAFNWLNVLTFDLSNQRHPESVREDLVNKPWRPIPTKKITQDQTRRAVLVAVPMVLAFNYLAGVWKEGVFIQILVWLYNDVRGGDELCRDPIIAIAYGLFNAASLRLALGGLATISPHGFSWVGIISCVILTTMQVQDLKDQGGDRERGRKTVVLVFGENVSRLSIAFFVLFWSCVCFHFWRLPIWMAVIPVLPATVVALRVLIQRKPQDDAHTWRIWCFWTISLYFLPVIATRLPNVEKLLEI